MAMIWRAPKYSPPEWVISNLQKYANAEAERSAAERLVAESRRAMEDTEKVTKQTQRDVTVKIGQRRDDVKFWEKEIDSNLELVKNEVEAMLELIKRLDKATDSYREVMHISQQCLVSRERRRGIDLVCDDAEKELLKEVEVIQGILALIKRSMEQGTEQLRLNRQVIYNLEKDLKMKMIALGIDTHCIELDDNSRGNRLSDKATNISARSTSVDEWLACCEAAVTSAEKTRQSSVNLRSIIDQIMQATTHDMRRQYNATNDAMARRVLEVRTAKAALEGHLKYIKAQIEEVEENIDKLVEAIEDKDKYLRLAHTRLEYRSNRPGIELARDPAQFRLVDEVKGIEESLATLNERLHHSRCSLRGLDRKSLELTDDIAIKTETLFIDEVECVGARQSISINCF